MTKEMEIAEIPGRTGYRIAVRTKGGQTLVSATVAQEMAGAVPNVLRIPLRAAVHAANKAIKLARLEIVVE